MPSLHDRRVQDMCILIYEVMHGTAPTALRSLLTLRSKSRNLRGELILVQPRVITTKYGYAFKQCVRCVFAKTFSGFLKREDRKTAMMAE